MHMEKVQWDLVTQTGRGAKWTGGRLLDTCLCKQGQLALGDQKSSQTLQPLQQKVNALHWVHWPSSASG